MNRTINRLGAELVIELTKSNPEDYQKFKLMCFHTRRNAKKKIFWRKYSCWQRKEDHYC